MSPRRNRPRGARKPGDEPERPLAPDLVVAPEGWQARRSTKPGPYRCPGCNQEVRGVVHVVAWREDDEAERRHWHTPCWERARRTFGR